MVSPSREKHCAHTISEKQPTIHLARTRATGDPGCPSEGIGSRVKPIGRMQLLPPDSSPILLAALALAAAADAKNGSPAAAVPSRRTISDLAIPQLQVKLQQTTDEARLPRR